MSHVQIYDRAMCCSTGVCGPQVDPVLPRFAADLEWLKGSGHQVDRFNLAQEPLAFAQNSDVQKQLREAGVDCLPLVFVDGKLLSRGDYPSRENLALWTSTEIQKSDLGATGCCSSAKPAASKNLLPMADNGCCSGESGCC